MRKLMTTELLTHKRINDFQHIREEEVGRLVEAIRSHIGKPLDLSYLLGNLNLNIITRMGMSRAVVSSYEVEDPQQQGSGARLHESPKGEAELGQDFADDHELLHLVRGVVSMLGVQGIGDAVPWLSFLDRFLLPKAQFQQAVRKLNNFHAGVIQEHRQYHKDNPGSKPRDFVDVLISVPSSNGEGVTDDMIKSQIAVRGTDTSSTTTEWAMAELLRQPAALEQAVRELEHVVGRGREVAESDIPNLPYLQAVVKETLRMHPPVPFLIPHYSTEATTVGGYHIPSNTTVFVNSWALGHDPAYWEQPHQFRPERFLQDRSEPDFRGHHFQLLPFGAGRRMCPGMGLGLAVVHLTLAALLHSFAWSLPADVKRPEDLDMSEHQGITLHKAMSLKAVPAVRTECVWILFSIELHESIETL